MIPIITGATWLASIFIVVGLIGTLIIVPVLLYGLFFFIKGRDPMNVLQRENWARKGRYIMLAPAIALCGGIVLYLLALAVRRLLAGD